MFQLSPPVVSTEILVAKGGTMWVRNGRWILPEMPDFNVAFRNLLHAVNLRHGTDSFTSPPKEGVLRIFSPWKIRRLRPGLNPRTWVPKASTLPLHHRSRFIYTFLYNIFIYVWHTKNVSTSHAQFLVQSHRPVIMLNTNTLFPDWELSVIVSAL